MKPYQTNELTLFTLEELLAAADAAQPKLIPMPTATDDSDNAELEPKAVELAPGVAVTWADDVTDTDDDPIPFTTGRIVEIDGDEGVGRVA